LFQEKGDCFERKEIVLSGMGLHFKLTIPGFPHNILPVSCGDIGSFNKCLVAWKTGLKVTLLPLGRSCPLQTILLSDLVMCDSLLQIIWPFALLFLK
jgi:hypothetical protein